MIGITPVDPSEQPQYLIQQSHTIETSVHPLPVIVPEGENGTVQPHNEDDEAMTTVHAPKGVPQNIPFVDLDVTPVASDNASLTKSLNP